MCDASDTRQCQVALDTVALEGVIVYWRRLRVDRQLDSATMAGTFTFVRCSDILPDQQFLASMNSPMTLYEITNSCHYPIIYSICNDNTYRLDCYIISFNI